MSIKLTIIDGVSVCTLHGISWLPNAAEPGVTYPPTLSLDRACQ